MLINLAAALPLILWLMFRFTMAPGPYNMDQGQHKGSFFPLLVLYNVYGYIVFIFSLVGAVIGYDNGAGWPAVVLLLAALYALLFNGLLVFFYEGYLHALAVPPGKSNYTLAKYATVLSLGFSAVVLLIVGVAWTGMVVGR